MYEEKQKKLFDDSSASQQQEDQIKENSLIGHFSSLKISPFFEVYRQNFLNRLKNTDQTQFDRSLSLQQSMYISEVKQPHPFELKQIYASKNKKIMRYKVSLSHFQQIINIFNLSQSNQIKINFKKQINSGIFGSVFLAQFKQKKYAVKQLPLKFSMEEINLYQAIKEYSIMKSLSYLEVAPAQQNLFGFDIVTTQKSVYFSTEKCQFLKQYFSNPQKVKSKNYKKDLQVSLYKMHQYNITHNDIKPENIMFSPSLKKLVFIDFGLSQENSQIIGQMKIEQAKGSLYYCSEQMKNLFLSKQSQGYVDMYYNDYFALQKSFLEIEKIYYLNLDFFDGSQNAGYDELADDFEQCDKKVENKQKVKSLNFQQELFASQIQQVSPKHYFEDQKSVINLSIIIINLIYLISQQDIQCLKQQLDSNPESLIVLNQQHQKILFIFLQIQFSINLYKIFTLIRDRLKNSQLPHNQSTLNYIERVLNPYFDKYLLYPNKVGNIIEQKYLKQKQNGKNKIKQRFQFKDGKIFEGKQKKNIYLKYQSSIELQKQSIKKTQQFLKKFQPEQFVKMTSLIQIHLVTLKRIDDFPSLDDLVKFNKMFTKAGIFVQLDLEINYTVQEIQKIMGFYLRLVYTIYQNNVRTYSIYNLYNQNFNSFQKVADQRSGSEILRRKMQKNKSFFYKLNKWIVNDQNYKFALNSQQHFQYEIYILQKIIRCYRLVDDFSCHKILWQQTLQLFNQLALQHLSFKLILETGKKTASLFFNTINRFHDSLVSQILRLKNSVNFQIFCQAKNRKDTLTFLKTYQNIFTESSVLTFPSDFSKLCEENQIPLDWNHINKYLNQHNVKLLYIKDEQLETLRKTYLLVILIELIPYDLRDQFRIFQKYLQVYNEINSYGQNLSIYLSNLKEHVVKQINMILYEQDKFVLSNEIFSYGNNFIYNPFADIFKNNFVPLKKINKNQYIMNNPIYKLFQKINPINPAVEINYKNYPQFDQYPLHTDHGLISNIGQNNQNAEQRENRKNQQLINTLKIHYENQIQSKRTLQSSQNGKLKHKKSQQFSQQQASNLNFIVYYFLQRNYQQLIENLKIYHTAKEKQIQKIKQIFRYLQENQTLLSHFHVKLNVICDKSLLQKILKRKILYEKLLILHDYTGPFSELSYHNNSCEYIKQCGEYLQNDFIKSTIKQINLFVDENFRDKKPIYYFQILIKYHITVLKCTGLHNQQQKYQFYKILKQYCEEILQDDHLKYILNVQFKGSFLVRRKKSINPFLSKLQNQQIFIDLLLSSHQKQLTQIQQILIRSYEKITEIEYQSENQNHKIKYILKDIFYFMKQNQEINRFFLFKQLYHELVYYLVYYETRQFILDKHCDILRQKENRQEYFVYILIVQILGFVSNLSCRQYSYFCIKVVQNFLQQVQKNTPKQNCLEILEKLQQVNFKIYQKVKIQNLNYGAIFVIQSQILINNFIKLIFGQSDISYNGQNFKRIYSLLMNTKLFLSKICDKIQALSHLARIHCQQRILRLALIFMSNKRKHQFLVKNQNVSFQVNHLKQMRKQKYFALKYIRSIRGACKNKKFQNQRKNFIMNIENIEQVYHQVSYEELIDYFLAQYTGIFKFTNPEHNEFKNYKKYLSLPVHIQYQITNKVKKFYNNIC